jgi:hypothetical protein
VTVSQAEYNRMQAETRRLRKETEDRKRREEEAASKQREEDAKARGDFKAALAERDKRVLEAEARADRAEAKNRLRDEIASRGITGSKAGALMRLVDLDSLVGQDSAAVTAAVEDAVLEFPDLFAAPPEPTPEPGRPRRPAPSSPPDSGQPQLPEGFLSMEEYSRTPIGVRHTPEFQARADKSKPYWPTSVPASSFNRG